MCEDPMEKTAFAVMRAQDATQYWDQGHGLWKTPTAIAPFSEK